MEIYRSLRIYDSGGDAALELDRNGYLEHSVEGRTVLHVGCSDWPLTSEKIQCNNLLHRRLQRVAKSVIGIDLSEEGLTLMRENGIDDVFLMDAEKLSLEQKFDVVLAGDVLEHMNNPGLFLERAREVLNPAGEIIIAVPSALTFANVKAWLKGVEQVHRDHTFYYSPKTLATLCERYDMLPTRLRYTAQPAEPYESSLFIFTRTMILKAMPAAAPAIIMHFSKAESVDRSTFTTLR